MVECFVFLRPLGLPTYGIELRRGGYIPYRDVRYYFSSGYSSYPYYYPRFEFSVAYYSPYSFYYGFCPPYIYRRHTYYGPPSVVYIEVPIYVNNEYRGYDRDYDDYYLNRNRNYDAYDVHDRNLDRAVADIEEAFRYNDIERLVFLTDPSVRISIFLRGKYEYSMDSRDYLDLTRDAMRTIDTIDFDLYRVRRRSADVYVASGRHVYRSRDGQKRTVYVSFVLERIDGRWVITQAGTAPDRVD